METWDAIVVGGGPAGMMAACRAALRGRKTLLVEKNPRLGAKILLSGGSRCNLTHAADRRGILEAFGPQGRFLHSAIAALGPDEVVDLFRSEGVATQVESTGKVFPQGGRAADVQAALIRWLQRSPCTIALEEPVQEIKHDSAGFQVVTSKRTLQSTAVVLTTGGQSYPAIGTSGDGYRWAATLGHTVVPPRPALVPVTTNAPWVLSLQGITVPDVAVRVVERSASGSPPTCLAQRRGSLLFTHFGLSGPVVLDVSREISGHPTPAALQICCDFLPEITRLEFERQLQQRCAAAGKRLAAGILGQWLPQRLADALAVEAGVAPDRRAAELTRAERPALVLAVKQMAIPVSGTMGFRKAEVTAGGVALDEVDSRTMQSRRVPGLYIAGELLDLDGWIGGYNFQAAFSTGWLAGESV